MQVLRDGNNKIAGKFQALYAQAPLGCLPQRQTHRIWKSSMLFPLTQKPNLYCLNQNNLRINKNNTEMVKKIFSIAAIAIFAAGAAILTSCNKEDEVINDVPAMEMKNVIDDTKTHYVYHPNLLFLYCRNEKNANGQLDTICECVGLYNPEIDLQYYEICGTSLDPKEEGDVAVAHMETTDGKIDRLVIYGASMDKNLKNLYLEHIRSGRITFTIDCPITDPEILKVLKQNFIPAGDYPIIRQGEDFVIIIEK